MVHVLIEETDPGRKPTLVGNVSSHCSFEQRVWLTDMQERSKLDPDRSLEMEREMRCCPIAAMAVVGTSVLAALSVLFVVAGLYGEPTWRSVVAGDPQLDVRRFSPEQVHISLGPDETQMVITWYVPHHMLN